MSWIGIVDYKHRNDLIIGEATRTTCAGLSVMALVQQTRHGEILHTLAMAAGLQVVSSQGDALQQGRKYSPRTRGEFGNIGLARNGEHSGAIS